MYIYSYLLRSNRNYWRPKWLPSAPECQRIVKVPPGGDPGPLSNLSSLKPRVTEYVSLVTQKIHCQVFSENTFQISTNCEQNKHTFIYALTRIHLTKQQKLCDVFKFLRHCDVESFSIKYQKKTMLDWWGRTRNENFSLLFHYTFIHINIYLIFVKQTRDTYISR